ncbi:efflux RND transporter periplasmic adaptor subunit [Salinimicrobium sp. CDJ15-81-2]|nr:efflux RND transporter periplasmic adaptor subunit [Salinimicrobium nanhaiense]
MKRFSYLGLILGSFLVMSCGESNEGRPTAPGAAPYPVIEVPERTVTGYTTYPVSLEGTVSSAVRAKVPGYITAVLVDEGEQVRKGQALFRLETESLSQEAEAARANVSAAQVEVDKLKPLVEKNIISPVQLQTAEARLQQAKAGLNSITANIGYATIKSPVDGNVGAINFRQGALVSPGDPMPLTTVSDIDEVYAFFSMNESEYLNFIQNAEGESTPEKLKNMPPVELELVNGQLYPEKGEIQTVTGIVDRTTGTIGFRAEFPNPNGLLFSGNSGRIRIPKTYENVPVVPQVSTYEQQGKLNVYVVQGDTVAVLRTINERDRVNNLIVVESGLKPGEKIIAQGVARVRNGMPIQPQPVPFDSIANTLQPVFK